MRIKSTKSIKLKRKSKKSRRRIPSRKKKSLSPKKRVNKNKNKKNKEVEDDDKKLIQLKIKIQDELNKREKEAIEKQRLKELKEIEDKEREKEEKRLRDEEEDRKWKEQDRKKAEKEARDKKTLEQLQIYINKRGEKQAKDDAKKQEKREEELEKINAKKQAKQIAQSESARKISEYTSDINKKYIEKEAKKSEEKKKFLEKESQKTAVPKGVKINYSICSEDNECKSLYCGHRATCETSATCHKIGSVCKEENGRKVCVGDDKVCIPTKYHNEQTELEKSGGIANLFDRKNKEKEASFFSKLFTRDVEGCKTNDECNPGILKSENYTHYCEPNTRKCKSKEQDVYSLYKECFSDNDCKNRKDGKTRCDTDNNICAFPLQNQNISVADPNIISGAVTPRSGFITPVGQIIKNRI